MSCYFLQINMSIGSINEADILALYTPSGNTQYAFYHANLTKGIFELKNFWAERSEDKDPCCDEAYSDIT